MPFESILNNEETSSPFGIQISRSSRNTQHIESRMSQLTKKLPSFEPKFNKFTEEIPVVEESVEKSPLLVCTKPMESSDLKMIISSCSITSAYSEEESVQNLDPLPDNCVMNIPDTAYNSFCSIENEYIVSAPPKMQKHLIRECHDPCDSSMTYYAISSTWWRKW